MNTIDRTKKLLLVLWNGNCDHAFVCSDKIGYYDKGERHEKEIAKHLSKPGTQVVFLSDNTKHDDTEIIFNEYLPNIIEGKNSPNDYGFEVTSVFNTLGEWADEDEDEWADEDEDEWADEDEDEWADEDEDEWADEDEDEDEDEWADEDEQK